MSIYQKMRSKKAQMKYFSGFGFEGERELFSQFLSESAYDIAGFSYGAQKAVTEALKQKRVQKLILISPAIFTHLSLEEKKKQIELFKNKKEVYLSMFYKRCGVRDEHKNYLKTPSQKELEELFSYEWRESDLRTLYEKGCKIEVYIGSADKIVDIEEVKKLFLPYSVLFTHQGLSHILRQYKKCRLGKSIIFNQRIGNEKNSSNHQLCASHDPSSISQQL
eukprot:TRINITY_DN14562_c0_g2_i1.p2 TRINITY_DN14562_c0_g2~~TRINITY_DN14562_c0_g2_i1.p2  ORF type:complete len:221 (-),score=4.16 TRINITY_DN14562_c0_g2_i1:427-1089(-)